MHTLIIILIVLLAIITIAIGIVAFVLMQLFFTIQPILDQLGKISMVIEGVKFIRRRFRHRNHDDKHD